MTSRLPPQYRAVWEGRENDSTCMRGSGCGTGAQPTGVSADAACSHDMPLRRGMTSCQDRKQCAHTVTFAHAGSMAMCEADYAAYQAAVKAGGNTAATYNALYGDCHATATALAPVKAASMAAPSDAGSAQAAGAQVASAVGGLPDLTVSQPRCSDE